MPPVTKNLGQIAALFVGTTPPSNINMIWYDNNIGQKIHKYYDTSLSSWKAFVPEGLWNDRGNYDASTNLFPSTGGSGASGVILKGNIWTISVAGVLGGQSVVVGDTVRALTDSPAQTSSNWAIGESNLGYIPENKVNKVTDFSVIDNITYPTTEAVENEIDAKISSSSITSLLPVISQTNSVPVSPTTGDRYLAGTSPGSPWLANYIYEWGGSSWTQTIPVANNIIYITSSLLTLRYNGSTWVSFPGIAIIQNGQSLGVPIIMGAQDNQDVLIYSHGLPKIKITGGIVYIYNEFIINTETGDRIAYFDSNKKVKSADTATYPSLTELSYVKGLTSAVQTQLSSKAPLTGTGLPIDISFASSDETTALTTGTAKFTLTSAPFAMTITEILVSLVTVQTSGSIFTINIKKNGTTIFSTKATIDNTEKDNSTAATPPVLSITTISKYDTISVDIDQIGDGGNATDYKGYANGTLTNGATAAGTPKVGSASFVLDGVNDYVALPVNTFLFTSSFTVSAWYYTPANTGNQTIFSTQNGVSGGFRLETGSSKAGFVRIFYGIGAFFDLTTSANLALNTYTNLVVVHKAGVSTSLYVNGVLDVSVSNGFTIASTGANWPCIGVDQFGLGSFTNYFSGNLDVIGVWNRDLSSAETLQVNNVGAGLQPPFI